MLEDVPVRLDEFAICGSADAHRSGVPFRELNSCVSLFSVFFVNVVCSCSSYYSVHNLLNEFLFSYPSQMCIF